MASLSFDIPPGTIGADRRLDLDFRVAGAVSPFGPGVSDDYRELGLFVSTIAIQPADD
jgi:hypothetical protein